MTVLRLLHRLPLLLAAGTAAAAPLDSRALPAPDTEIWVGRHRLHLYCTGQGVPSVVLNAGLGGNSLDWQRVQPRVADFTRVCSYDRNGYGWSNYDYRPRTSERLVVTRHSGHHIQLEQPELVIEAIREVVERVRGDG